MMDSDYHQLISEGLKGPNHGNHVLTFDFEALIMATQKSEPSVVSFYLLNEYDNNSSIILYIINTDNI